jgi:hypothetical protein
MSDPHDPILDACLEELLSGQGPPDLQQRILAAWEAERGSRPVAPRAGSTNRQPPVVVPRVRITSRRRRRARSRRVAYLLATLGLVLIGGVGIYIQWRRGPAIATRPPAVSPLREGAGGQGSPDGERHEEPSAGNEPRLAAETSHTGPEGATLPAAPSPSDDPLASPNELAESPRDGSTPRAAPVDASPDSPIPSSDEEIVRFINAELRRSWQDHDVRPSQAATEGEWCRRAYLRMVGSVPPVRDLQAFLVGKRRLADRKRQLVESLCVSPGFVRHWAAYWTNALIGRTGGTASGASREHLELFLREAILQNKPYDQLVVELLSSTGTGTPGSPDYSGAVNFLLASLDGDGALATTRTCQTFLGLQLQCAQCHNHPFNKWEQREFWQINAFFRQLDVERRGGATRLVKRDFPGATGSMDEAEINFEQPNGVLRTAYPVFLDGTELPRSGAVATVDRQQELARLVAAAPQLGVALVNRLWSHFLGYGFTRPVDDMGPHNPASHPELLQRLATEFAAHDYDVPRLMRWIVLSDAFGLSSRIGRGNDSDQPDRGTIALFSRYYARPLEPEQVYESLQVIADAGRRGGSDDRSRWLAQFYRPMQTDDASEETTFDGGLPQALAMMNGQLTRRVLDARTDGALKRLALSKMSAADMLEYVFLATVARPPTARELDLANRLRAAHGGDHMRAIQDMWWALLNSGEFILDH